MLFLFQNSTMTKPILYITFLLFTTQSLTNCKNTMHKQHANHLIHETSPYLLQHAHNPVEWYPWGEEALQKAQKEDKLLLISIGYSACHWCHVMAHESFEDPEVAALMNRYFVCIKVDREERPDVDQVYMDAVQLLTGRGGWPLNCFALPDGRPVYGGTYYYKNDWSNLLKQLAELYANEREKLLRQAEAIQTGVLKQENARVLEENPIVTFKQIEAGIRNMAEGFDTIEGGFNGAPKFPMPSIWNYLLDYSNSKNDADITRQIQRTLEKMALGGIYDHVGGGFARYSVDAKWHIPHFEKMLYDNGQLVSIYSKAYRLNKNEHYKRTVYETLNFIKRELTSTEGAFYAALDADSEGVEGKFYSWTSDELKEILGNNYSLVAEYYSVSEEGNWENGLNVLMSVNTAESYATHKRLSLNDFLSTLETAETKLLAARNKRIRPGLDDKILTSWNALMLKGYIDAYKVFQNETFLNAALSNAHFIQEKMMQPDGSLHRTYKDGTSKINGFLDDYAFTINAFIDLYQVTFDEKWLHTAWQLTDFVMNHFIDQDSHFFFYTSDLDSPLVVRKKEITDNVVPSSNAVMAENLWLLSKYYGDSSYADKSRKMMNSMVYEAHHYGRFYSNWARCILNANNNPKEVIITGSEATKIYQEIEKSNPANVIYAIAAYSSSLPIFEDRFVENETLVYICENNTCQVPVSSAKEALELIGKN